MALGAHVGLRQLPQVLARIIRPPLSEHELGLDAAVQVLGEADLFGAIVFCSLQVGLDMVDRRLPRGRAVARVRTANKTVMRISIVREQVIF